MIKPKKLPWENIRNSLNTSGFASIPNFIDPATCQELISLYSQKSIYRKTVTMERHRFGKGEYKYFNYPLPSLIQQIRRSVYPYLVPIANQWMSLLQLGPRYQEDHDDFIQDCHDQGQQKPTPLILSYDVGGYNTLHQDLYGTVYFPFQMALFLSGYGTDYQGGEFIMTEQIPRSQSKVVVRKPSIGEAIIFSTAFRPILGTRGYYRAHLRHGVGEVLSGKRYTLGVIFHDATS